MNGDALPSNAAPFAPAKIFRETALQRLSSPEQLGELIHVTSPKTWIAVVTGLLLIVAAVIWGIVGTVPVRVSASGVLSDREGRLFPVTARVSGMVTNVLVKNGDQVKAGQTIATLATEDLEKRLTAAKAYLDSLVAQRSALDASRQSQLAAHKAVSDSRIVALNQRIEIDQTYSTSLQNELTGLTSGPQFSENATRVADVKHSLFEARRDIAIVRGELVAIDRDNLIHQQLGQDRTAELDLRIVAQRSVVDDLSARLQQTATVLSPIDGVVVEASDAVGTVVSAGMRIAMITTGIRETDAVVYLQSDIYQSVGAGAPVLVVPAGVDRERYGGIVGKVLLVDAYPSDRRTVEAMVQDPVAADEINKRGLAYAVRIDLSENAQTPSGLAWSSSSGPPYAFALGTLVNVYIDVRQEHPIALVIPALAGLLGG